jgi:hypothetical protein
MKEWQFQYPSTALTRTVKGDKVYASQFRGEADKLLYELKNQMKFNALGQLKMTRYFTDGTIITAWSIFGQDFVNIDTTLAAVAALAPACVIEFINPPEKIPPMKWYAPGQEIFTKEGDVWIIKDPEGNTEVEGVDYLKTYYRLSLTNCTTCSSVLSTVCETDSISSPECHPYTYDASKRLYLGGAVPYFQGHPDSTPPVPPDPENHLIYSFYDSGQAEILKFDHDAQGTYFLWKAYTEWEGGIFSRTGLGYLLLKLFIQYGGNELCQVETIVKVDCCEKAADDRKVEIWWEDFGTCSPFIMYGDVALCKMPQDLDQPKLRLYSLLSPYDRAPLYAIPDIKGSCIPFEWTLSGPGELIVPESGYKTVAYYITNLSEDCHDKVTITLTDRCGVQYVVQTVDACSGQHEPLSIGYTSLMMECSEGQNFSANGGIGPYEWSLAGGGTLTQSDDGSSASYTAPASNAGCAFNPTITVTDCCGDSADIKIAVNCYTPDEIAYNEQWANWPGICGWADCYGCGVLRVCGIGYKYYSYRCDGSFISETLGPGCPGYNPGNCAQVTFSCNQLGASCEDIFGDPCDYITNSGINCGAYQCQPPTCSYAHPCGYTCDKRTQAMKDQGCCPINPWTGLPF